MDQNLTFTNTKRAKPEIVDLDKLNEMYVGLHNDFIAQFCGIQVKVDDTLQGNQYYIAVSREIHNEMARQYMENRNNAR